MHFFKKIQLAFQYFKRINIDNNIKIVNELVDKCGISCIKIEDENGIILEEMYLKKDCHPITRVNTPNKKNPNRVYFNEIKFLLL